VPKALRPLAGVPMIVRAVDALRAAQLVDAVVVAAPADFVAHMSDLLGPGVCVVPGGSERVDSVRIAIAAIGGAPEVVLVHDAARPLTPPSLIDAVASAVLAGAPAVIPVLGVTDTIKEVDDAGVVVRTIPRVSLRAVQTPQGFRREVLEAAYALDPEAHGLSVTDDAGLVEALGTTVLTVPGSEEAFKVTRPADLLLAEAFLAGRTDLSPTA
jgi:2-C-methyl-D-erythritol 4-phosphate cytidylyltransferase